MTLFLRTYKITLLKRTLDIFTSSNMHAISNPKILLVHAIQANTFAGRVFSSAHEDFASMGIMVISYTVKEVHDDVGYLSALGQSRTAEVLRDARVGEAKARMESQVAEAKAEEQRLFIGSILTILSIIAFFVYFIIIDFRQLQNVQFRSNLSIFTILKNIRGFSYFR